MATFTVTTLADENDPTPTEQNPGGLGLSLREALVLANASGDADTILFDPSLADGTLYLTSGQELLISTDGITIDGDINGDGTPDITISADSSLGADDAASRVFRIDDNEFSTRITGTLNGLVIRDGKASSGGGIHIGFNDAIRLSNSSVINNNASGEGGGIYGSDNSDGTLTNVTVSNNFAGDGGGLYLDNVVDFTFINSTISNNTSVGNGGGIYVDLGPGSVTLINTTIAGNHAGRSGGAIWGFASNTLELINSTVTGNRADTAGGGIFNSFGDLILTNSIVAGNDAPVSDDLRSTATSSSITYRGQNILGSTADQFETVDTSNGSFILVDGSNQSGLESVFADVGLNANSNVLSGARRQRRTGRDRRHRAGWDRA